MPRFLTGPVAKAFVFNQAILRPFQDLLNIELKRGSRNRVEFAKEYFSLRVQDKYHIWADTYGTRLTASMIRYRIKSCLSSLFEIPISFSDWRQVHLIFM